MRTRMGLVIAGLVAGLLVLGPKGAIGEKKDKPPKGKKAAGASVTVVFTARQRDAARGWFVDTHGRGNCPPGLAKKGNGCLPPGQARKRYAVGRPLPAGVKWTPAPAELEVRIGAPPDGYIHVILDGDLVKLAVGTLLVVDAIEGLVN